MFGANPALDSLAKPLRHLEHLVSLARRDRADLLVNRHVPLAAKLVEQSYLAFFEPHRELQTLDDPPVFVGPFGPEASCS